MGIEYAYACVRWRSTAERNPDAKCRGQPASVLYLGIPSAVNLANAAVRQKEISWFGAFRHICPIRMLTLLRIKNLGLVDDLTWELHSGYNVITGETGAGKSMLIGALNLVLGERADRSLLRSGAESCSVEAVFEVSRLKEPIAEFLDQNGLEPCEENQLLLKRVFTAAGTNRQFINGSATSLATLGEVGQWLVDIHGPHEHQSLLLSARQLAILDAFGGLEDDVRAFSALIRERDGFRQQKAELIVDERTYAQQLDLLRFQVSEIQGAALKPGEDAELEVQHRRAGNAARLLQLGRTTLEVLAEKEESILVQAGIVGRAVQELGKLDPAAQTISEQHAQAVAGLNDLLQEVSRYCDKLEVDPVALQELEERLNLVQSLKRKYGSTIEEVLSFEEEASRKLRALEQRDEELAKLNAELVRVEAELLTTGQALSARRKKVVPQLTRAVSRELSGLGFAQSRLEVELQSAKAMDEASLTGLDRLEFQFAPNPGEPPRPLRAIASSGELARVMLALKTVLAAQDQVPVLVFDEVDANVGGETAHAVGERMQRIAAKRQVLCITHLPQVAAPASAHYVVSKSARNGRTVTEVHSLQGEQRVTELARMLGGQTEAARKHAAALLKDKNVRTPD